MAGDRVQIGQQIKVPNQDFLDRGKRASDTAIALSPYMQSHGGSLPPDPAHPPSLVQQVYGEDSKAVAKNGYTFNLDPAGRTRSVFGELSNGKIAPRSKDNQAAAGGAERLRDDDGGHFIAARFNGPNDAFNHFAQNRNFNRGAYRSLEGQWAKDLQTGRHVTVAITDLYPGTSKRPVGSSSNGPSTARAARRSSGMRRKESEMTADKLDLLGPAFAEIGHEASRLTGGEPNGILLYVEAGENWAETRVRTH